MFLAIVAVGNAQKTVGGDRASKGTAEHVTIETVEIPKYTPLMKSMRLTGEVKLLLDVLEDGHVSKAEVLKGNRILADVAVKAALNSKFQCESCKRKPFQHRLTYAFEIVKGGDWDRYCYDMQKQNRAAEDPKSTVDSASHVTVRSAPVCIID